MPQAVAAAPSFATRNPDVLNSGGALGFSMPVLNSGNATAEDFTVTDLVLGSAARLGPALPVNLGALAPSNAVSVNGRFSAVGLTVGGRYMLTARGTYRVGSTSYGWTLNRVIIIPAPVSSPVPLLAARLDVQVDTVLGIWSYTLRNDETSGSPRYLNTVSVDMGAPFSVIGSPVGWAADTDGFSYVLWYSTDVSMPYPNHVAPGAALSGFRIQSGRNTSEGRGFVITSWNHSSNQADLTAPGSVLTPSRT